MQAVQLRSVYLLVTLALLSAALVNGQSTEAGQSAEARPPWGSSSGSEEEQYAYLFDLYDNNCQQNEVYDFVVVGSGAAGSVVAGRLAQSSKNYKILVLEAGGPSQRDLGGQDYVTSSFYTNSAGALTVGRPFTRYDVPYFYSTILGSPAQANDEYDIPGIYLAKLVGGSMAHNGMLWIRPTQYDLNSWNVTDWDWPNFLPYMIKSENSTGTSFASNTAYHGLTGPIKLSDPQFVFTQDTALTNACLAVGGIPNNDLNGATREGCASLPQNTRNGVRSSSAIEYLLPQLKTNPRVITRIHKTVSRVLFTTIKGVKTVTGVEYYNANGLKFVANVTKEVILSGSAIHTPQILINSGIGPAAQLSKFNIPPVYTNPNVGIHLRNHKCTTVIFNWTNVVKPNVYGFGGATLQYATSGTGFLAQSPLAPELLNFKTLPNLADPDVTILGDWGYLNSIADPGQFGLYACGSNPAGADGVVTLNSTNPFANPLVNSNLLANQADLDTLTRGVQKIRAMMATPTARSFFNVTEIIPGPGIQTNAQFNAYYQQPGAVSGLYHYTGTTRMGNAGDTTAVVDNHLRVLGVSGLRVVDGSIATGPIFFGAQAAIVGIAEKGAYIILQDNL